MNTELRSDPKICLIRCAGAFCLPMRKDRMMMLSERRSEAIIFPSREIRICLLLYFDSNRMTGDETGLKNRQYLLQNTYDYGNGFSKGLPFTR